MMLHEDNHPFWPAVDGVLDGDRDVRTICDDDGDEDDCGDDGDEDWLLVARLGRLTDRAGVDGFLTDAFLPDFLTDADGVTADFGFFADRVGVRDRDLGRLAGDAFFAEAFLADRDGVGLRPGVAGVDDEDGFGPFLPGVLAISIFNFVSSDLSSLLIRSSIQPVVLIEQRKIRKRT